MLNLDGLFIASLVGTCVQVVKEAFEPTVTMEQIRNERPKYPEPHRDASGKVVIENCKLFEEDKRKYGVIQAYKWVEQGKYNLTSKELEIERERIKKKYKELYNL